MEAPTTILSCVVILLLMAILADMLFSLFGKEKINKININEINENDFDTIISKYNKDLIESKRFKLLKQKINMLDKYKQSNELIPLLKNSLDSIDKIEKFKKMLNKLNYDKLSKSNKKEYKLKEKLLEEEKAIFNSYINDLDHCILNSVDDNKSNKESFQNNLDLLDLKKFGLNINDNIVNKKSIGLGEFQ